MSSANEHGHAENDANLVDRFYCQSERYASRAAMALNGQEMTYAELNRRSNQIAHLLLQIGVKQGDLVALLVNRDITAYPAILGVLKAGAAYLPIDPAYPEQRIQQVLNHSQPAAVLSQSDFLHRATADIPALSLVALDELKPFQKAKKRSGLVFDNKDISACIPNNPVQRIHGDDLAYVIYTSGSTGTPKGVMVSHRSVVSLITGVTNAFQITPEFRILQNYSLAFDPSVQEIFSALINGATLVPVSDEIRINPPRFLTWLRENRISYWDTVPSLWYRIVDYVDSLSLTEKLPLPDLRVLVLGGEALTSPQVRQWMRCVQLTHHIYNMYGLTETTVTTTYYQITNNETHAIVPIGQPLPNNQAGIFPAKQATGQHHKPCPPGITGEIWVGGTGLAKGYLNAPDLTAAAFVQDPVSGQKLYKTGDLGRLLPDGNIEFLGRADEQVKVRGYRIEPAEIEMTLGKCPGVNDVTIVITADDEANKKILAYYISKTTQPDEVRDYLKVKLPHYMIPHHFVQMGAFPLTANNKVDKRALLKIPVGEQQLTNDHYRPPTTNSEQLLVQIWKDVLNIERISTDDDFFTLGGDSILSIMIRHKCEAQGIHLQTIDLFRYRTISALAQHIDTCGKASPQRHGTALQSMRTRLHRGQRRRLPANILDVLPLFAAQAQILSESTQHQGSYLPQVILHCTGKLDFAAFSQAVNLLVGRHEALRSFFSTDLAPEAAQIVLTEADYAVGYADLTHIKPEPEHNRRLDTHPRHAYQSKKHRIDSDAGQTHYTDNQQSVALQQCNDYILRAADHELSQGFDVTRWPLFRITIYQKPEHQFSIVWTSHHLIMDGWSTTIFYRELMLTYARLATRQFRPLPSRPCSLSQVVRHISNKDVDVAHRFWRSHLAGSETAELPKELCAQQAQKWVPGGLTVTLHAETTQKLRTFARKHAITTNVICLSAYYLLLKEIVQQQNLIVSVVTSGRSDGLAGVEHIIGNLINFIPLHINPAPSSPITDLLQYVQETLFKAIEYDYLPSAQICSEVYGTQHTSHLFDCVFVAENYPAPMESGAISFETFNITDVIATESNSYPLTLVSSETEDKLIFNFEYAAHLFRDETIRTWSHRYIEILTKIPG
ncbi:MAG: amino acid adenylation domain-containing protein [Pseudomonadota bacterium]